MAVQADVVRQRIIDTIIAVTTHTAERHGQVPFTQFGDDEDPERSAAPSGLERRFLVRFGEAAWTDGPHTQLETTTNQEILVIVMYPPEREAGLLDDQIRLDVRDIKAALDIQSNWGTDVAWQSVSGARSPQEQRGEDGELQALLSVISVTVHFHEANS